MTSATGNVRVIRARAAMLTTPTGVFGRFRIDLPLLFALLAVSLVGLAVLYSASGQDVAVLLRQLRYLLAAWLLLLLLAQLQIQTYRYWVPAAWLLGVVLLGAVLLIGTSVNGAQRWLALGDLRFQPSELMKLLVPVMLSWYLASHTPPLRFPQLLVSLLILGIPALLVSRQPDLGTALLIVNSGLIVLFAAGVSWWHIFVAGFTAVPTAWLAWVYFLHDYQRQRILTVLDPERDKLGAGWNIIQSKTAIGSGGWSGKGWLQGTQSQLDFLPESYTDFAIAVLAEEFGLRGVLFLLLLYLLVVLRCSWIGIHTRDSFSRLTTIGLTATFFTCVFVNMGMASGLLPVVGVPLPLVSAGGTSIITLLGGFGILMAISKDKRLMGN